MESFQWLLVIEPNDRVSSKKAGVGREHEHPNQEFLVVCTIVGWCVIPLPLLVP